MSCTISPPILACASLGQSVGCPTDQLLQGAIMTLFSLFKLHMKTSMGIWFARRTGIDRAVPQLFARRAPRLTVSIQLNRSKQNRGHRDRNVGDGTVQGSEAFD